MSSNGVSIYELSGRVTKSLTRSIKYLCYMGFTAKASEAHPGKYLVELKTKRKFSAVPTNKEIMSITRAIRRFQEVEPSKEM